MANYYRLKIDVTYTNNANATTATTNINNVLIAAGRPESATRTNAKVTLTIPGLATEAEAVTLADNLLPAWSAPARSFGEVSIARTDVMT